MATGPLRTESVELLERRVREIGWFPEVRVSLSYWHGGRMLKEGSTFCRANNSAIHDAREDAERFSKQYRVDQHSSLELVLCRYEWEVVKIRAASADDHWDNTESHQGLPRNRLLGCSRVWSSKTGEAPPLNMWPKQKACFIKTIPITGDAQNTEDLSEHFNVGLGKSPESALCNGLAISAGVIQNLVFENIPDGSSEYPGRYATIFGDIEVAIDPRCEPLARSQLLGLIQAGIDVEAWPSGRSVLLDTSRISGQELLWTIV